MTRSTANILIIASACLLACAHLSAPSFATSASPPNRATTEPDPSANAPTVLSVLTLAMEQAELPRNEASRLPLRYRVAIAIKRTRQELSFRDYVYNSISFWENWDPRGTWIEREFARRHASIEAQAKKVFLAGDQAEARRLLDQRQCNAPPVRCANGNVETLFLQWELDSGNLAAAVRRIKEPYWLSQGSMIYHANLVAHAFISAGKRNEALQFLSELRATTGADASIAELYWIHGATEEGKRLLREAARKDLDAAARNPQDELPVWISGSQWIMGDTDGAAATLNRIMQFDKTRLSAVRAPLAGRLALAGRDADATALLTSTPADRATLAFIAVGQARRGEFDAALRTIERLNNIPLQRVEIDFGGPSPLSTVVTVERIAARAGKLDVLGRVDELRQDLLRKRPTIWGSSPGPRLNGPYIFDDLARNGHVQFAIERALATTDLSERISGLCAIAEVLAGLPDPSHNPFLFFEAW